MKQVIVMLALMLLTGIPAPAQTTNKHQVKKDTTKSRRPAAQHVVKGRRARMRLQEHQIKQHEKGWKQVDSVQKRLDEELHKSNDTTRN